MLLPKWMESSTNASHKACTDNKDCCTTLRNIPIYKMRCMPILNQLSETPPLPEASWGMHILVVWSNAARDQLITKAHLDSKKEAILITRCNTEFQKRRQRAFLLTSCHAQSLAATNRVTEQLSWLTVESFYVSCSIIWMVSLIDNLYLLDLIVLVINWQHVRILRGTIRGDP